MIGSIASLTAFVTTVASPSDAFIEPWMVVIALGLLGCAVLFLPIWRSATARRALLAEQEARAAVEARAADLASRLDAELMISEGLSDQVSAYKVHLADLLNGIDVATAFFGADRRLMAWTEAFEQAVRPPGVPLERGLSLGSIWPNLTAMDDDGSRPDGEVIAAEDYLDQVGETWVPSAVYVEEGGLRPLRCRRIAQGWVLSLADEAQTGSDQDRAEMERALQNAREELSSFLHLIGHDLRAPLRALKTLPVWIAESLDEAETSEQVRDLLNEMEIQAIRVDRLLVDLLAFARAGNAEAAPEAIDAPRTVADIVAQVEMPDGFSVDLAIDPDEITAPRKEFEDLLRILILNAVRHHTGTDGNVAVSLALDGDALVLRVQDDGPGIPPEAAERVFKMFATMKPRDEVEGSGMGLTIARKIVEGWGGAIGIVEDNAPGTCVEARFPTRPVLEHGQTEAASLPEMHRPQRIAGAA
ncbi:MAG: HAMP domain-containing sensor histidine kinase [Pseudomonadota bacterium]